jgi:hypothetical protein
MNDCKGKTFLNKNIQFNVRITEELKLGINGFTDVSKYTNWITEKMLLLNG